MDTPLNDKSFLKFQSYLEVTMNFLKGKKSLSKEEVDSLEGLSTFLKYYSEYFSKASTLIDVLLDLKNQNKPKE